MGRQKKGWRRGERGLSTDSLWRNEEPVTNPNPVLHESAGGARRSVAAQEADERMRVALLTSGDADRDVDTDDE